MQKVKTLKLSDIAFDTGRPYICVGVALNNHLSLTIKTFWGIPRRDEFGKWIQTGTWGQKKPKIIARRRDDFFDFDYVSSLGLTKGRSFHDNHHRVFYHNDYNKKLLGSLVRRQDIVGYLTLIGVKDSHSVIERNRRLSDEADRMTMYL